MSEAKWQTVLHQRGMKHIHAVITVIARSWDSSVVQRCATGWMIGVSSPGRGWEFFSSPPRPDRFWGPSSLLSNGYQGFFPWGVRMPEREADHSPKSSVEVENAWSYISTPPVRLRGVVLRWKKTQRQLYIHLMFRMYMFRVPSRLPFIYRLFVVFFSLPGQMVG
jgi:hypothetical protein